jgi:uncharacterized membrane protein YedE/YeeE
MSHFTPGAALLGGALIALALGGLLVAGGRVGGVSGALGGLVRGDSGPSSWRLFFVLGLVAGGLVWSLISPTAFSASPRSLPVIAVAGLLVGIGTRMGGGCTSGHGVCGTSRFSTRSIVATATFVAVGAATATMVRLFGGLS